MLFFDIFHYLPLHLCLLLQFVLRFAQLIIKWALFALKFGTDFGFLINCHVLLASNFGLTLGVLEDSEQLDLLSFEVVFQLSNSVIIKSAL